MDSLITAFKCYNYLTKDKGNFYCILYSYIYGYIVTTKNKYEDIKIYESLELIYFV